MDDVLRRLASVESAVADLRGDVRHLATKAELSAMETRLVKAMGEMDTRLSTHIASLEGRILRWLVATVLASVGAAATVAKFFN
jgi:hypothetical protein